MIWQLLKSSITHPFPLRYTDPGIVAAPLLVFGYYVHDRIVASTPVMHHDPLLLW